MKFSTYFFVALVVMALGASTAQAQLYWDTDPGSSGAAGNGDWDSITANWNLDPSGVAATQFWGQISPPDDPVAFFSAPGSSGYTVHVASNQSAGGLTMNDTLVTVDSTGGTLTLTGATPTVTLTAGDLATITAPIAGASGLRLAGGALSTLVLGGANTYSGVTRFGGDGSSIRLGAANVIPDASVLTMLNGSTQSRFDMNGNNETVKSISSGGTAATNGAYIALGTNELTLADDGETQTYTGVFTSSGGGKVIKSGTGSLTLGGSSGGPQGAFTGGEFHLKKGTLQLNVANSLGTFGNATTLKINPDGNIDADAPTIRNGANLTMNTKFLEFYGNFTVDLASGTADTLQWLGGAATATSEWGRVTFTLKTANPEITVKNSGTNTTGILILNGKITDNFGTEGQARGFTKKGAGVLSLQNTGINATNGGTVTSDFKGDVTIMEGTLRLVHQTTAATNTTNATNLDNAGMLEQTDSGIGDGTGTVHLVGGTLSYTGAVQGAWVDASLVTRHPNDPRLMPVLNPISVEGDVTIGYIPSAVAAQVPATDVTFQFDNNNISGTAGTVTFSRASNTVNTYRPTFTGNGFNFSRPIVISNDPADSPPTNPRKTVLTSSNSTGTQTWSGAISGSGGFRRTTSGGTTVLTAANTFTGGALVDGGTLTASGASATLGGGNVTVTGGNIEIAGGVTDAILNSAILSLAGGGGAGADVAYANLGSGILERVATLILGGGTQTNGLTYGSTGSIAVVQNNEYFAGTGMVSTGLPGDFNNDLSVDAGDYVIWSSNTATYGGTPGYNLWRSNFGNVGPGAGGGTGLGGGAAVPEPASIALLMLGLAALAIRRGRR